jgi:hypothetical protein
VARCEVPAVLVDDAVAGVLLCGGADGGGNGVDGGGPGLQVGADGAGVEPVAVLVSGDGFVAEQRVQLLTQVGEGGVQASGDAGGG